jgi:hypothetical protein
MGTPPVPGVPVPCPRLGTPPMTAYSDPWLAILEGDALEQLRTDEP